MDTTKKSSILKSAQQFGDRVGDIKLSLSRKVLIAYFFITIASFIIIGSGWIVHREQSKSFEKIKSSFKEVVEMQKDFIPPDILPEKMKKELKNIEIYKGKVDFYSKTLKTIFAVLFFGFILLTIGSKFFTDSVMIRPIVKIAQVSKKIAEGDLEQEVKITSRDEIGMLALTFNHMTQNLKQIINYQRQQITKLLDVVNSAPKGDLTKSIDIISDDEFGELSSTFNNMVKSLNNLVKQTEGAAEKLGLVATEILAATQQQAAGVTEQATQITEIAASLQELTATSKQIAESTQLVAQSADHAASASLLGGKTVESSIHAVRKIDQTVQMTAKKIRELGESSRKIGKVITAISDIAEQTNLLALNAAIEAARAGEQGRGFAVVADEIRKLAERSSQSAEEINNLITSIQQETNSTVMAMEDGIRSVEDGVNLINSTGEAFREITKVVEQTSNLSKEISLSTDQQTKGSEQLSYAMTSLSQVVKQTEITARQNAQSAHNLNDMAKEIKQAISMFVTK